MDATGIFESEVLKDYDFGEVYIEEVQICEMGVQPVEGEIRYKSVGKCQFASSAGVFRNVIVPTRKA
jgi:hypothetical protein